MTRREPALADLLPVVSAVADVVAPLVALTADLAAGVLTARRRRLAATVRRVGRQLEAWQVAHAPVLVTPYRAPHHDDVPPWARLIVGPTYEQDTATGTRRTVGVSVVIGTLGLAVHRPTRPGLVVPDAGDRDDPDPLDWLTEPYWRDGR